MEKNHIQRILLLFQLSCLVVREGTCAVMSMAEERLIKEEEGFLHFP